MELLFALLILLILTRAFGEMAHRLGQPALLGELVAGVALGVTVKFFDGVSPFIADLPNDRVFLALTDLGIFFLMLYGGVELRASKLAEVSGNSFFVAACGLFLPAAVGLGVAWAWLPESPLKLAQALFVGVALAITAVPVSIRLLMDLGQLNSKAGQTIVAAAIIDDVLSLVLLAVLVGMMAEGGSVSAAIVLRLTGSIVAFFVIAYFVGHVVVPHVGRFVRSLRTAEFEFSSLLLAALGFAVLAELLNLHFVLGAFVAGLLFERRSAGYAVYEEVKKRLSAVTLGFLAPIFFASIGLHLDLSAAREIPLFLSLLIVVAFVTKLLGAGIPAWLSGLSPRDATAVGVGMSARGAVELIVADIALRAGLFAHPDPPPPIVAHLFSAIVIVALVTTLVTPIALRRVFSGAGSGSRPIG